MPTAALSLGPASRDDLRAVGRLGALLVRLHNGASARNETAQRLFVQAGFRRTMIEMTRELGPAAED